MQNNMTRREAIGAVTATGLTMSLPQLARAAGHAQPFKVIHSGSMTITTLLASTREVKNLHNIFGINVADEIFNSVAQKAGLDPAMSDFFFTPTLVEAGGEKILFDTGTGAKHITESLMAAGHHPDEITKIVLTHMHGDHISGLSAEGMLTFKNAAYYTGADEFDHWDFSGNEGFETHVRPISDADQFEFLSSGDSVVSGITAEATYGHTPGHMSYRIEADGAQFFLGADFTNHYIYSLAHPDWHVLFDADKEMAAKTRRKTLDMLGADKIKLIGYHMPFPAVGYVEKAGDGFRWIAV